ncbi:MAG: transposase [Sterolibacteriaceae bacterium]|nr:transposase [Sterolibacteriaceae bacterium]
MNLSMGTLTGGLQAIAPLFEPVYEALLDELRAGAHWHADETRWEVFVDIEGKRGHRWYLWVFRSRAVAYYVLDASRSAAVSQRGARRGGRGTISCDRYGAYKKFARLHPGFTCCIAGRTSAATCSCWPTTIRNWRPGHWPG